MSDYYGVQGGSGGGGGGDDTNVHTIFFEKAGPSSYSTGGFSIDLSSTFSDVESLKITPIKGQRGNLPFGRLEYSLNDPSAGIVNVKVIKYRYDRVSSIDNVSGQPGGVTVQTTSGQTTSSEAAHTHDATHDHAATTSAAATTTGAGVDTDALAPSIAGHTHSVDIPSMVVTSGAGTSHSHVDNSIYQHSHDITHTATGVSQAELTAATNLSTTLFLGRATGQRA